MSELAMIFVGGLLGSSHCLGMCGPLALSLGSGAPRWTANLRRQLAYSAGRIFTYAVGGAAAGYAGMRLGSELPSMVNVQAALALVAGALLVFEGLVAAGIVALPARGRAGASCLASGLVGTFLRRPRGGAFLAGVFTGFLPCGLVYAYLALAASAGNLLGGMSRMAAFGAGTVPLLVATGCGGALLNFTARRRALRIAAWFVVATGVVSIARGLGYIELPGMSIEPGCPMCP